MTAAETQTFERAAAFRRGLAEYLGLPDGADPVGVGITLGPADTPVIAMPLDVAERRLADAQRITTGSVPVAAPAGLSPLELRERVDALGRVLLNRMGREVTLVVAGRPPVTGIVRHIMQHVSGPEPDRNDERVVLATDLQGDVEVSLRDVVEFKAWSS